MLLGQVLELRAREQTGGAIRALLNLAPKTARRLTPDGEDEEILLEQVQLNDWLRVRPGDRVPVDGTALVGMSADDESMVSGGSMPTASRRWSDRWHHQRHRVADHACRQDRCGYIAVADRLNAGRGTAQPCADSAHGRHGVDFVPAVILVAILAFIVWAIFGPAPTLA